MGDCPKCGASVEHPIKSWKIKQTPIGLFECPACKAKWRNKISDITVSKEKVFSTISTDAKTPSSSLSSKKITVEASTTLHQSNQGLEPKIVEEIIPAATQAVDAILPGKGSNLGMFSFFAVIAAATVLLLILLR